MPYPNSVLFLSERRSESMGNKGCKIQLNFRIQAKKQFHILVLSPPPILVPTLVSYLFLVSMSISSPFLITILVPNHVSILNLVPVLNLFQIANKIKIKSWSLGWNIYGSEIKPNFLLNPIICSESKFGFSLELNLGSSCPSFFFFVKDNRISIDQLPIDFQKDDLYLNFSNHNLWVTR